MCRYRLENNHEDLGYWGMTQEILFQNGTATMGSLQGYTGFGKIIKAGKISEFAITDDFY